MIVAGDRKTNHEMQKTPIMSHSDFLLTLSRFSVNKQLLREYLIRERYMEAVTYCSLASPDFYLILSCKSRS